MTPDPADLAILKNCELLKQLPDNIFQKIMDISQITTFQKDDDLAKEGENSDTLFIILSGSVNLYKKNKKGLEQRVITSLGSGESIGEMRILKNHTCSLTVKVNEPTRALVIPISALHAEKYHESFHLLSAIIDIMNKRIKDTNYTVLERINDKIRKMKQLWFALLIIVVLSFFFLELFFALFYLTNTESFCNFQNKMTGTEDYQVKQF